MIMIYYKNERKNTMEMKNDTRCILKLSIESAVLGFVHKITTCVIRLTGGDKK